ncbi:FMOD protein, partial [Ptilonorhynchus violaceus]|nr:FMOD protein [Ptilonorhynchus violaceus]
MLWATALILAGLCGAPLGQYNEEEDLAWLQYYLRQSRAASYNYIPYYEEENPPYVYSYPSGPDAEPEPAPEPQRASPWRCPQECDCPPTFPSAMYCDGRGLRYLPFVPSRMRYVYFQNNLVTSIQDGAFDNATELEWLALHNNRLGSRGVGARAFAKLGRLERLYLNNNNLTRLPGPLPRSLRELHLSYNQISEVPPDALEGLENLTALYLSHNYIFEMGASLKGLRSLILADLSYNRLGKVPDGLPASLEQLYLEYNRIEAVPGDYFRASPRLLYVRMSHNGLTERGLSADAFNSSSILELDLSYNRLRKIPRVSTNLENLYLQGNRIDEFSISSFCSVVDVMNYSRLQVLRLDGNEIKRNAVPPDAPLCLRRASVIEI